ncbi:MAG: hypothetical protein IJ419_07305 [Agathobacter sp.]|nr:hypothetical protein [Agathobacter sp.]
MANIKSGADIKEMYDVQNIVSACILRAAEPLTIPELVQNTQKLCEGSTIQLTNNQLQEMVEDTVSAFRRINLVTACNGKYYAYPRDYAN